MDCDANSIQKIDDRDQEFRLLLQLTISPFGVH
jgi:hypothetical protein